MTQTKKQTRKPAARKPSRKKGAVKASKMRVVWRILRWLLVLGLIGFVTWVLILDVQLREKFDGRKWALPARVYAQPLELYQGLRLRPDELVDQLKALGYRPVRKVYAAGQYSRQGQTFQIYSRGFEFSDGVEKSRGLRVSFRQGYVDSIAADDSKNTSLLRLEPLEIGGIYPAHKEDRLLVRLEDIPALLGETLIAIEDRNFLQHYGVSPKAILRAMLANIKAGGVVQGGSTLTQQLVKNFYLSHEQSLTRKAKEAILSVLLELHYSKREILETYINEIYLGQSGQRGIHGFGLAAEHYFARPVAELNSAQVALLVGVVKGASYYNPWRRPERAKKRRDLVLKVMLDSGLIDDADYRRSVASSLGVKTSKTVRRHKFPAFLDLVKRQLLDSYSDDDLRSEGLQIFTSFSLQAQLRAERAVKQRLAALERDYKISPNTLETAVVSVAVGSAEIQALVGGRKQGYKGFNRALDAKRSIGSLVKPAIYLTALEQGQTLATQLNDTPVKVKGPDGVVWQPKNFDNKSHGATPMFNALARSYNQAAARLGMQLGLDEVATTVELLEGNTDGSNVPRIPAMLLGAVEWSPLRVASMYHSIAADGFYTPLRAIRSVQRHDGSVLERYALVVEQRFGTQSVVQLKAGMETVMRTGSGRSAYKKLPKNISVAGKTGTSNDQRDSWFAGFSDDNLIVTWLGHDNNKAMPLTGASGALRLWTDIMAEDPGRSLEPLLPGGMAHYWVDSETGLASGSNCYGALQLPFIKGAQPRKKAACEWRENPLIHWWKNL